MLVDLCLCFARSIRQQQPRPPELLTTQVHLRNAGNGAVDARARAWPNYKRLISITRVTTLGALLSLFSRSLAPDPSWPIEVHQGRTSSLYCRLSLQRDRRELKMRTRADAAAANFGGCKDVGRESFSLRQ